MHGVLTPHLHILCMAFDGRSKLVGWDQTEVLRGDNFRTLLASRYLLIWVTMLAGFKWVKSDLEPVIESLCNRSVVTLYRIKTNFGQTAPDVCQTFPSDTRIIVGAIFMHSA